HKHQKNGGNPDQGCHSEVFYVMYMKQIHDRLSGKGKKAEYRGFTGLPATAYEILRSASSVNRDRDRAGLEVGVVPVHQTDRNLTGPCRNPGKRERPRASRRYLGSKYSFIAGIHLQRQVI